MSSTPRESPNGSALERPDSRDVRRVKVGAAVVLYHPDLPLLVAQRDAVLDQVDEVLYVDNGMSAGDLAVLTQTGVGDPARVSVVGDGVNVGLARGLNLALAEAARRGWTHCLLLDQDSVPVRGMVDILREGLATEGSVVAVGPAIQDELTGVVEDFARLRLPLNTRIRSAEADQPSFFDVDFLITSGTLIAMDLLDRAGFMDESLFIDCIDFDWSFRARSRGLRLLATFRTTLSHRRGDSVHALPGGGVLRVHSADRMYYMHRNRVRLYRRPYVPVAWKVHDVARLVVKLALLTVFVPHRRARMVAALRGIRDGLAAGS